MTLFNDLKLIRPHILSTWHRPGSWPRFSFFGWFSQLNRFIFKLTFLLSWQYCVTRETVKQLPIRDWDIAWSRAVLCDWLFLKTVSALGQKIWSTSEMMGTAGSIEGVWLRGGGGIPALWGAWVVNNMWILILDALSQEEVSMACSKEATVFVHVVQAGPAR